MDGNSNSNNEIPLFCIHKASEMYLYASAFYVFQTVYASFWTFRSWLTAWYKMLYLNSYAYGVCVGFLLEL